MWKRNCPICNREIIYKNQSGVCNGNKRNSKCRECDYKSRKGTGNYFYGKRHSKITIKKMKKTNRDYTQTTEFSQLVKRGMVGKPRKNAWTSWNRLSTKEKNIKISKFKAKLSKRMSGKNNPMYGKPAPQGSGNGWSGWYDGWYFRSLHELSYMIKVIKKDNLKWESAEKKELKIKYIDPLGHDRTYVADFIINNNIMIECKPKRLWKTPLVLAKKKAAQKFCNKINLKYRLVETQILTNQEIMELYNSGQIKWLPRYEEKFKKRYCR